MTANEILSNDVLCGRGGATNNHPGNKAFRSVVAEHMTEYLQARKREKAVIAKRIVDQIRNGGGRFLKRDPQSDAWVEVTDKKATEKTSQALREGLDVKHKTYRPEKMARRDSESSDENPRKRARLVEGKVVESPRIVGLSASEGAVPELSNEDQLTVEDAVDPLLMYFEPPRITQEDCGDTAQV